MCDRLVMGLVLVWFWGKWGSWVNGWLVALGIIGGWGVGSYTWDYGVGYLELLRLRACHTICFLCHFS